MFLELISLVHGWVCWLLGPPRLLEYLLRLRLEQDRDKLLVVLWLLLFDLLDFWLSRVLPDLKADFKLKRDGPAFCPYGLVDALEFAEYDFW